MNEEQQQAAQKELKTYYLGNAVEEWTGGETLHLMSVLERQGLLSPQQRDPNSKEHGLLWLELEQLYCEDAIHRLQEHLQDIPKNFPELFQTKRAFVEVEYCRGGELDEDLDVTKVTVNGVEVTRIDDQPTLSTNRECYWPVVELADCYLDLHLIKV